MTGEDGNPCPACQSNRGRHAFDCTDSRLMTTSEEFPVRECLECSSLFLDSPPPPEALLRHYPDDYFRRDARAGLIPRAMENYRALVLKSHARKAARAAAETGRPRAEAGILDIGAGSTRLSRLLRRMGFRTASLDISPRAFEAPSQDEETEVIIAPAEKTGLKDSSFEVVTLFHSLEHSSDPGAVLREAHRILSPGGRLIVEVPNAGSFESRIAGSRWYGLDVPRHAVSFSRIGLLGLLSRSGFRPLRVRHFCLRDSPASLVSSFLPALDPSRRRALHRTGRKPGPFAPGWAEVLYFLLVVLSIPLALGQAAAGRGGIVAIEAEKESAA